MKSLLFLILLCLIAVPAVYAGDTQTGLNTYEQKMVSKTWVTTGALDRNGASIPASDERVAVFFGNAEYFFDHNFSMTTPDGQPKMHGRWSMSGDGKTRTLTVLDENGQTRFTRVVENVKVEDDEYVYRIYPEETDKAVYFDIVHRPE